MRETRTGERQQSPIKLALAAGLSVVFIVVVVVQVKSYSGDATASTHESGVTAQAEQHDDAMVGEAESFVDDKPVVQWPTVDLDECIAHDPFAAPTGLAPNEQEQANRHDAEDVRRREAELARERALRTQAISELKEAGVRAILKGPDHSMAILGTGTIRVGEEIYGYRVVAIDTHGIVLEPITDQ
jgi:hypothetical protein